MSFEQFWDAYGYKKDRISAERTWNRLSAKDRKAAMAGIEAYRKDCANNNRMMCYAQGYLNRRRWEDDFTADGSPAGRKDTAAVVAAPTPSNKAAEDRERETEERERRYRERVQSAVSHEAAKQSEEYWRALNGD